MARRPSPNAPVDQRTIDLAKIDGEIVRLGKQIAEKQAVLLADTSKHALDQSPDLQRRLGTEISTISVLIDKLRDKRFKVEIGEAEAAVAPKPAASVQHRAWEIDENILKAGPPSYPDIVRGSEADDGIFSRTFEANKAFWEAAAMDLLRKDGFHADQPVHLDFAASLQGELMAVFRWAGLRCKALEDRVKELEQRPSVEYRGVWSAGQQYKRGNMVTHKGSVWHAEIESTGLESFYTARNIAHGS